MSQPAMISAAEAARRLGVVTRTIRRRAAAGALPGTRDADGIWHFDPADVEAARAQQPPRPAPAAEPETEPRPAPQTPAPVPLTGDGPLPLWLTAEETAALLRTSVKAVRSNAQAGRLPARQIGGGWRIHRSAVEPPAPATP